MKRMVISFQSRPVHESQPWPVGVDAKGVVTSGLGPDDGARLIGFQKTREQHVDYLIEAVIEDPGLAVGGYAVFSNGHDGIFTWNLPVRHVLVVHSTPITEAEFKKKYADFEGDAEYYGHHQVIVENWHDVTETPSECIARLNSEVVEASRLARPVTITVNDILAAYEEFRGQDVGTFTSAWDDYLAGRDKPCPEARDGLHQDSNGSCDLCGAKNRG